MAQPLVQGDKITGQCMSHQVPNPSSGAPQPAPPMPFSAPLMSGLEASVTIGGKPVAVLGSSGRNAPPHIGLHVSDPYAAAMPQEGKVVSGSPTVTAGGKAVATSASSVTMCASAPGTAVPTVTSVSVA
jgi:uncharacterized Zn-binding protein involved in type VI secretion